MKKLIFISFLIIFCLNLCFAGRTGIVLGGRNTGPNAVSSLALTANNALTANTAISMNALGLNGAITVLDNGNTGFGTITPSTRLEVIGTISGNALQISGTVTINGKIVANEYSYNSSLGTNLSYSGTVLTFTLGEAVSFGQVLYLKSDGKLWKANASTTTNMPVKYMALESANADSACKVLKNGIVRNDSWNWIVGGAIFMSTTAGSLTQTAPNSAGNCVQSIGVAVNADVVDFDPEFILLEIL